MKTQDSLGGCSILRTAACAVLAGIGGLAAAQTNTVRFTLEDVWLLPDISHPRDPARQMTGTFEWTYEQGDFENGSGAFTELFIPWWIDDYSEVNANIELTSIEFTLGGNYHDLGLDISLFLLDPLSPDQPAAVDAARSRFDIQRGISYQGHAITGVVVPDGACSADIDGNGVLDADDFFGYLDLFAAGDPRADVTGDGVIDADDFFAYLDLFVAGC